MAEVWGPLWPAFDVLDERVVLQGGGGGGGVMEEVFRVMDWDGDDWVGFANLSVYMDFVALPATDDDVWAKLWIGGGVE